MCLRLSKLIRTHLRSSSHADRRGPCVWVEDVEDEKRKKALIERIRYALAAHYALREVAQIMQSVAASRVGCQGPIRPSSLRASLVRVEEILGDVHLTRFLRLHINARIVHRLFTAALASSVTTTATSRPTSSLLSRRQDPDIAATFAGKIVPLPTLLLPPGALKRVNTIKPLEDSDSDDFGDFDYNGGLGGGDNDDDSDTEDSGSPSTPLDAAFSSRHSRQVSFRMSNRFSMNITMPSSSFGAPQPCVFWLDTISDSDEEDDSEDELDESIRDAAREQALRKLCQGSQWVQKIRDAEPVTLAKRRTRISAIPTLLTVGEEKEEEE